MLQTIFFPFQYFFLFPQLNRALWLILSLHSKNWSEFHNSITIEIVLCIDSSMLVEKYVEIKPFSWEEAIGLSKYIQQIARHLTFSWTSNFMAISGSSIDSDRYHVANLSYLTTLLVEEVNKHDHFPNARKIIERSNPSLYAYKFKKTCRNGPKYSSFGHVSHLRL